MRQPGRKQTNLVHVKTGEYVPIPGTKVHVLAGPGRLEVERHPDGRITGRVVAGETSTLQLAVKRRYKRLSWGI